MRTGIKTIYKRARKLVKYPDLLFNRESSNFPDKGISEWKLNIRLYSLVNELSDWKMEEKIGSFHCAPHPVAIKTWKKFLRFNPNNLGNWSLSNQKDLGGTARIEKDLIKMMISLYGGDRNSWEGYITSGATESCIYSVWIGRNLLLRETHKRKVCIVVNDLTHYSVFKAADICDIDLLKAPLNRENWAFDVQGALTLINNARKKYKGFLVPLTLGYTQTGTNDDFQEITQRLRNLESEIGIKTYVFIDAALNGLVLPFIKKQFFPLENLNIQTFYFDFHKSGMVPVPCGIVLYRKTLHKFIEKPIFYIDQNDTTLLGTRSGISPVSAWAVVNRLGKKGFIKIIKKSLNEKNKFIERIKILFPYVNIIDRGGISIGLVTKKKLPVNFLYKYGLYAKRQSIYFVQGFEKLYIYKIAFLYGIKDKQ